MVTEFFPLKFDREADLGPYIAPRNEYLYRAALTDFLRRGAQVRDRLEHLASVIHVKDVFRANRTGYIVEEYAAPPAGFLYADLAHRISQTGPLPAEQFLPLLEPVIRDLGAAHQAGILHGELTTDHLLLNDQGGPQTYLLFSGRYAYRTSIWIGARFHP